MVPVGVQFRHLTPLREYVGFAPIGPYPTLLREMPAFAMTPWRVYGNHASHHALITQSWSECLPNAADAAAAYMYNILVTTPLNMVRAGMSLIVFCLVRR